MSQKTARSNQLENDMGSEGDGCRSARCGVDPQSPEHERSGRTIDFVLQRGAKNVVAKIRWPLLSEDRLAFFAVSPGGPIRLPKGLMLQRKNFVVERSGYDWWLNRMARIAVESVLIELRDLHEDEGKSAVISAHYTYRRTNEGAQPSAYEAYRVGPADVKEWGDWIAVALDVRLPLEPDDICWIEGRPHAPVWKLNILLWTIARRADPRGGRCRPKSVASCRTPEAGWPGLAAIDRQFSQAFRDGGQPVGPHLWKRLPSLAPGLATLGEDHRLPYENVGA
jgi:hypothetical protein